MEEVIINYKVTVIIPVFNAENTLEKSVESLINQTIGFENIEVIIVDDNSTDKSKNIIQKYDEKYDNIKGIYLDKNSGFCGKPRNIGINHSSTNNIIFLDADDEYLPNGIETLYKKSIENNSDMILGTHYIRLNEKEKIKTKFFSDDIEWRTLNPKEQKDLDKISLKHFVAAWGKLYKKNIIEKNNIKFPEDTNAEDICFYFNYLLNSNKITILNKTPVYNYNIAENTAIHGHDINKFNNFLKGIKYQKELFKDSDLSFQVSMNENIESLLLIFTNLNKNNKKEAIEKIYDFEKSLGFNINPEKKEIRILNNEILKQNFNTAIRLSNLYSKLYNNKTLQNAYKKLNNTRN